MQSARVMEWLGSAKFYVGVEGKLASKKLLFSEGKVCDKFWKRKIYKQYIILEIIETARFRILNGNCL